MQCSSNTRSSALSATASCDRATERGRERECVSESERERQGECQRVENEETDHQTDEAGRVGRVIARVVEVAHTRSSVLPTAWFAMVPPRLRAGMSPGGAAVRCDLPESQRGRTRESENGSQKVRSRSGGRLGRGVCVRGERSVTWRSCSTLRASKSERTTRKPSRRQSPSSRMLSWCAAEWQGGVPAPVAKRHLLNQRVHTGR